MAATPQQSSSAVDDRDADRELDPTRKKDMDELARPESMPEYQCDECGAGATDGWCIVCARPVDG